MRIVHISYHFDEYVLGLVEGLKNKVSKKFIFVSNKTDLPSLCYKIDGCGEFVRFDKPRIRNIIQNIILVFKIFFQVKSFNPDIIHLQEENIWVIPLTILFRKHRIILTIHDVTQHIGEGKKWREFSKYIIRRMSHKYIVHGKRLKQDFLEKNHWAISEHVHVIPHGPLSYYKLKNKDSYKEQEKTILFFGRIFDYKGLDILIKAEPLISKKISDYKIIIAGQCNEIEKYERLITDHAKYKIINKFILEEEIAKIFQEASVIVLPYREASQSGIIPIAYEFKRPVVASKVGSIPEVVNHLKTGILVEKENVEELANALCELLSCREKRRDFGEAGFQKLYNELNWNKIGSLTVDAYQSL